jgi:choline-sulfatase
LPEPRLRWLRENNQHVNLVRSYLACISFIDSLVGRIIDAVDARGIADNTLIVLWSDHGYHLGEKDISGKNTLWERSTRVPLIFAGPGITPGQVCKRPAELIDIYPTLAELASLPQPAHGLEGLSLAPQLTDATAPRERPAISTHNQGNHAVITEEWRFIRYVDGAAELYDIRNDPHEWTNLAAMRPEVVKELRRHLPTLDRGPAPGSKARVLTYYDGVPVWEGKAIGNSDPIPHDTP